MGSSDIETIKDAGLDKFLSRVKSAGKIANPFTKYTEATNISGGTLGNNAIFNVGSKQVKIDGPKSRITVNDGVNDRILFGKREDGTFGIDVSSVGFDVHSAYEAEMDLSSKSKDDWIELNPAIFSYSSDSELNTSTDITTLIKLGDKIKWIQDSDTKYGYVIKATASKIYIVGEPVINDTVDQLFISDKILPNGMWSEFVLTNPLSLSGTGSLTVTQEAECSVKYWLVGANLYYYAYFNFTTGGTTNTAVKMKIPYGPLSGYTGMHTAIEETTGTRYNSTILNGYIYLYMENFGNWSLGYHSIYINEITHLGGTLGTIDNSL